MTFVGIEGGVANEKTCPYEGSRFERSRRSQTLKLSSKVPFTVC